MKKFYMLMITVFTILIGATGCGDGDITEEYGVEPTDYDNNLTHDEDTVINDDTAEDADVVSDADTPAMEYGPIQTDYDATDSDVEVPDNAGPEYGVQPVDYDTTDSDVEIPDENPDEMTTDYGPISTKFHK